MKKDNKQLELEFYELQKTFLKNNQSHVIPRKEVPSSNILKSNDVFNKLSEGIKQYETAT